MQTNKNKTITKNRYCRSLISLLLAATSLSQLTLPVFALTAAGTSITNKATATYSDGTNTIATESNVVTITVAEVAGIEIQNKGVDNLTSPGNALQNNHDANFKFHVENTGNDATKFVIPKTSVLAAANAASNGTIQGVTYQLVDSSGIPTGTLYDVDVLAGTNDGATTISLLPGQKIVVNVKVKVTSNSGNVSVRLGSDPAPATGYGRVTEAHDVYTEDNADGTPGDISGAPINGVREASNLQTAPINVVNLLPFVKVEKTTGSIVPSGANGPADDELPYNLKVKVAGSTSEAGITIPSGVTGVDDLNPTFVKGLGTKHVLVSDALPANTELAGASVAAGKPTPPSGWKVVYSTQVALADGSTSGYNATWVDWDTTAPASLTSVKQIGFVYTADSTLAKGTTTDFSFKVKLKTGVANGAVIRNIAQVFGEKDGVTPTISTTPTVYDESGDAEFNNDSNGDGFGDGDTDNDGDVDTLTDPTGAATNNDDPGNNTGSGDGGEYSTFTVTNLIGVLNGTVIGTILRPDAEGLTSNNDDFTNKNSAVTSSAVPLVSFNNSLRNTDTAVTTSTFTLIPQNLSDLPQGDTIITIQYTGTTTSTVVYTVSKASPTATPAISITGGNTGGLPLSIPVSPGTDKQYSVTVKLPDSAPRVEGFDVPILAFVDVDNDNSPDPAEAQNITIDRVYTGFVQLLKKSQILDSSGTAVSGSRGILDINPKSVAPGERMKYAIDYTNISEAQPGSSGVKSYNGILTASGMTITERGDDVNNNLQPDPLTGNNWAADLDGDSAVDTLHVGGSGIATSTTGTVKFGNDGSTPSTTNPSSDVDTVTNTGVDNYIADGITLAPQATGTFSFQRKFKP